MLGAAGWDCTERDDAFRLHRRRAGEGDTATAVSAHNRGDSERSLPESWISEIDSASSAVDEQVAEFYRSRPGDLARSIAAHLFAFSFGVLQVSLLLGWLSLPNDWKTSLAIEAFSGLVGFIIFVVPGSVGVQEASTVLIFTALGLSASDGMSVGIAFRLNEIVSTGIGLALLGLLQRRALPRLE